MATYYVDPTNGSDSNNGQGPDASHVSNKPWATLGKALGAAGISSGDTVYLAPGIYRETISVAMTSAVAETFVLGDPANAQGFKTSGGARVASGIVRWSGYTTSDITAPSFSHLCDLAGRDHLTFRNIWFAGGGGRAIEATTRTSTHIILQDCAYSEGNEGNTDPGFVDIAAAFGVALHWQIDRCVVISGSHKIIHVVLDLGAGSDYDADVQITNSLFISNNNQSVKVESSSAGANKGGGVDIRNCTFICCCIINTGSGISTSIPCTVNNCLVVAAGGVGTTFYADTSGQITENYNLVQTANARNNVSAGANSIVNGTYAPLIHHGWEQIFAMSRRLWGEPAFGSPVLGFGNDGTQTAYDMRNFPRPAGGATATPAAGALERSNTWARETTTVRTGSNAISITGPGYQDYDIPVDVASTTVTCYLRCDSTYAGTKPQLQVRNGEECGVTSATSSAVSAANAWEQISLNFTPTSTGIVTIRILSNDTNGGGKAFADDFAVA